MAKPTRKSPSKKTPPARVKTVANPAIDSIDAAPPERWVAGTVRFEDGHPVSGALVRAFDKSLRRLAPLGEGRTTDEGRYRVTYSQKQFNDPTRGVANLQVDVVDDKARPLASSQVRFDAQGHEVVDLTIVRHAQLSEWERLDARLRPALDGLQLVDLDTADQEFVSKTSRVPLPLLDRHIRAAAAAQASELPAWFHYAMDKGTGQGRPDAWIDSRVATLQRVITKAAEKGTIPAPSAKEAAAVWARVEHLQLQRTLDRRLVDRAWSVRDLLDAARVPASQHAGLPEALSRIDLKAAGAWQSLAANHALDPETVARLRLASTIAELTGEAPAVSAAIAGDERVRDTRDLARHFDQDEWRAILSRTSSKENLEARAAALASKTAALHPTLAAAYGLARRLDAGSHPAVAVLQRWADEDEGFDLGTVRLDAKLGPRLEAHGHVPAQHAEVTTDLMRLQRLYRIHREPQVIATLIEDGVDSSAAVVQQGKRRFVGKYGKPDRLGKEKAEAVYRQAETIAARAFALFTHFTPLFNTTATPIAIAEECPPELRALPHYAQLFGTLDGCECEPCESVYSPAAYLTDLLHFLKLAVLRDEDHPNAGRAPADGLEALEARTFCDGHGLLQSRPRRPDISRTLLSCRNAETVMPYVDLVLEILENAVAPIAGATLQTTLDADQLAAQPEHVDAAAYTTLSQAVFPLSLPFDVWHEESGIYLEKLGTTRSELIETFYPFKTGAADLTDMRRLQDPAVARARLGISQRTWMLIADRLVAPVVSAAAAWGYAPSNNWWAPLTKVDAFLERSGLDYKDMLRLLRLKSFNPAGAIRLDANDATNCDPTTIDIEGLDSDALNYLHRFLRLQRAVALSLGELDVALLALGLADANGRRTIDEGLLVRLSNALRLRELCGRPLDEVVVCWAEIDKVDRSVRQLNHDVPIRSLYDRLFQSGRAGEGDFNTFTLNGARSDLATLTAPVADHIPAIAGAIALSQNAATDLVAGVLPNGARLSSASLSTIFRHALLSRALGLSVAEYLALKTLIAFDPFASLTLAPNDTIDGTVQTIRFVAKASAIGGASTTIADLDFLLRQTSPFDSPTVAPTPEWIDAQLDSFAQSVQTPDPLESVRTQVEALRASAAAGPVSAAGAEAMSGQVQGLRDSLATLGDGLDIAALTIGLDALLASLQAPLVQATITANFDAVHAELATLATRFIDTTLRPQLTTAVAATLGVGAGVATTLLARVRFPADASRKAGAVLLEVLHAAAAGTPPPLPSDLRELVYRLVKSANVVKAFAITDGELNGLCDAPASRGWLDLTALPARAGEAAASFDAWSRLASLFELRDALPDDQQPALFSLFDAAAQFQPGPGVSPGQGRRDYIDTLTTISGWNALDISALVGRFSLAEMPDGGGGVLKPQFPEHFVDERMPLRVLAGIRLGKRIGAAAIECSDWIAPSAAAPALRVERIKNALRARFGDQWPSVQKGLRDPLRERQRQALVAYLVQAWSLDRPDDLFDHFLIDVEMSPCMMTSRLIQATAAVQMFVQRVLLNLEPGLVLVDDSAEQWQWMKNYRVWEANRKIYLYPENWIEPDLRDDKTPFFKDLERELRQSRITNDTAETALLHYLEKLHEVARLQVCGQYVEAGWPTSTLHVFARTRETPHHYYYRRGVIEVDLEGLSKGSVSDTSIDARWTPWERVDLDIEGDHLIPFVFNRRVYLFWPIFMSEDEAPMAHTLQKILSAYGQLFKLVQAVGALVESVFKGVGIAIVGTAANGIIQLLQGLDDIFPPDLTPLKDAVKKVRTDLLGLFGVPASASNDDTGIMIANAGMPSLDGLGVVFQDILGVVGSYEQYLLSFLPAKLLKVQLAWSEHRGDNWTAKRVSNGTVSFRDLLSLIFENLPGLPGLSRIGVRRLFTFRGSVENGDLIIHCGIAMPDSLLNADTLSHLAQTQVTALTDDDSSTNRPAWMSAPIEIGYFRLNTCAGQVDAIDTSETIGIASLFAQLLDQMLSVTDGTIQQVFNQDRQLTQVGVPVTPDDDPDRPSQFRRYLIDNNLPRHRRAPFAPQDADTYRILARHQTTGITQKSFGFFYHDAYRTFFCFPWPLAKAGTFGFVFFPFYHPYTCALIEQLQRAGIPGIYEDRYTIATDGRLWPANGNTGQQLQILLKKDDYFKAPEYDPVDVVYTDPSGPRALRPVEEITFSSIAAYADYNWEIFFHTPLLIATRLAADQQFRDAQRWFHYIFNPTDASRGSVPEKYWRTRPFVERSAADYAAQEIDDLMLLLNSEAAQPGLQELEWSVRKWRRDAFNPHLIARTRTVAFQKTVVMKYIDNLVAWGDSLFRQETRESVNEALQLYVLAAKLLGPRPRRIPKSASRPERTYRDLEPTLDAFSNALVQFENYQQSGGYAVGAWVVDGGLQVDRSDRDWTIGQPVDGSWKQLVKSPSMQNVTKGGDGLYFCVPPNEQLLAKWDLVADRLFKIRHCLNIEGAPLQLPLLSPPIDPGVLVRAKAMGLDLDELLGEMYGPPARYRFAVVLQKAVELCGEVKALGSALLSAIEKRDGEAIALLRNTHEARVLAAVRTVKELQIEESGRAIEALARSQESAGIRIQHYQRLLGEFINPEESVHLLLGMVGLQLQAMQFGAKMASAAASLIPNFKGGFVTTLGAMFGGDNIGFAAERASDGLGHLASLLSAVGGLVQTMGGYRRRAEDWQLQMVLATKEQQGLLKQIAGAELRHDIARADLDNHQLQIKNNGEMQDTMQAKFSNHDLYDWMVSRVSTLHFQAYQMAYEMARQAERSFVAELGAADPGMIRADNWDSLKRGLLAGEHLHQDLKRLEVAYLARNVREYELTKHVSVSSVNPMALLELRATGRCAFSLPESLFDMDGPGHYFRRIKSVAVSVPCVVGPYTNVNCTLTLVKSGVRLSSVVSGPFAPQLADRDEYQSIVTSSAQNDSGLLETNLKDERYLPFENAGVISEWRLELPANPSLGEPRQFDYATISDVVLHVRYTARDGGAVLRKAAGDNLKAEIDRAAAAGCMRLLSARHDFPTEWARFKATVPAAGQRAELTLPIRADHYPFWSIGRLNNVKGVAIIARAPSAALPITVYDRADKADANARRESSVPAAGDLVQVVFSDTQAGLPLPALPTGDMKLYVDDTAATDLWVAVTWSGA